MAAVAGSGGYGENAASLAGQYESITFAQVHRDVLHLFPAPPSRVLDIGAGSGRDAAALARQGHRVTAVEPTEALRIQGRAIHAAVPIAWVDDALPDLAVMCGRGERFDLVLLTAVWMHLDAAERERAMARVAGLLSPGGRVVMSLRHGPVPEGRRMFEVSAEETADLGRRHGLDEVFGCEREDMLGRGDVRWSFLCLERPRSSGRSPGGIVGD
ncbi:class I SAM-dependent methyltransferase [uncultured Methylobacterium sp.]|jgi:SAM-dependent methyltransferase|uniref:class I SAM-dependent methyltransferase n=1 Tax=uncultured Methylobacterium sp. TaxID=157278 RepID=UPI00262A7265|nr:class I SAM-dependent methyltransferase [uncultured Methylobacterium sp.]